MDPKQISTRNKQRERRQRGEDFQDEIRRSWREVPNTWQLIIKDGGGGSRPADKLVICDEVNILQELKRTEGQRFQLSFLESNQIKGLLDFESAGKRNYGLVLVSFHNPDRGLDSAYAFRLFWALKYMAKHERQYITESELSENRMASIYMPRLEMAKPTYDVRSVAECYKYL